MYLLIKYYSKHIVARMHGTVQLYFQLRESIQLYLYNYIFNYQHFTNVFLTLQFFKIFVETSLSQESRYKVESLHKMMQTFSFPPRIKLKRSYHTYYGSSFYQLHQLEFLICTSILVFKHIIYATMPYISNVKIGCNFIFLFF